MWSTFATICGARGNGLPDGLRASIISISLWVDRFTTDVIARREPIDPLLEVNRSVRDGLVGDRA
jgi:flagellar protein FlaF